MSPINSNLIVRMTAVLGFGGLLGACANSGVPFNTEHNTYVLTQSQLLDEKQRADLYEAIIAGDLAYFKEEYLTAMSYYLYAAELSKEPSLIEKSIKAARAADDPLGLEQAAKIWLTQKPKDEQAKTVLLEAQISLGNSDEAFKTLIEMFEPITDSEARFNFLSQTLIGHDPRITIRLLSELQKKYPLEVAMPTVQAKLIFELSSNSQSPQILLNQALERTETALSQQIHFLPAVKLKSHILYQLRQDKEAVDYLQTIYQRLPESRAVVLMLGQLYYDLRQFSASANHFTGWLKEHPDDLDARYYQAASFYAMAQYHLSLGHFKALLGKDYQPHTVAFYCGDSARKTGDSAQAIECLKQVEDGNFYITARIQLANLYAEGGDLDKALQTLAASETREEDETVKLIGAEINLLNQFDTPAVAKARLEQALKTYPDNLSLLLKKIELYKLTQSPDKLFALLNQARDLIEPGEKLDRFNLAAAALLRNNGHYQFSIDWLDKAIANKPKDKDLLYTRALYKESLGLYDEMIDEFKYVLKLFPDDLNIKNALGFTLADAGKELEYAQELIDSAYQGLPNNAAVIDSKGWVAYRKGDLELAEKFLAKAFKMAPSAEGAAHLGEVFWQIGKVEYAKAVFKKGLELDEKNKVLLSTIERLKVELN